MSKYEKFIAFELVVRIATEEEFIKFCNLMQELGLHSIKYLQKQSFRILHTNCGYQTVPYGELCFEYQIMRGFTIGREQDYVDYGCEVISFDELIVDLEG